MNNIKKLSLAMIIGCLGLGIITNVQADINDGLVAYFPFNDTYGVNEAVEWLHDIENTGLNTFPDRFGVASCACDLKNPETGSLYDLAESYIKIPDQCEMRFRNAFSFSVWVYFIAYPDHKDVNIISNDLYLSYDDISGGPASYKLWIGPDNTLGFSLRNASQYSTAVSLSFPEREWTHIAAVWDDTSMRLYVNGMKKDEAEFPPIAYDAYAGNPVYIGASAQDAILDPKEGWNGYMDDFRIYNRSLSESEIQELQEYADDRININRSDVIYISRGSKEADFRMVSFVYTPQNPAAAEILGNQLPGGYNTDNYKIGTYSSVRGDYVEYGDTSLEISPGTAYWIYAKNGLNLGVEGVPVCKNEDVEIELLYNPTEKDGWNMIAAPNNAVYLWDNIEVVLYKERTILTGYPKKILDLSENDVISKRLWRWANGSYVFYSPSAYDSEFYDTSEQCLRPHEGYWVNVNTDMSRGYNVHLRFPASVQADTCPKNERKRSDSLSSVLPDNGEYPPSPIGSFNEKNDISVEDSGGGCFIGVLGISFNKRFSGVRK